MSRRRVVVTGLGAVTPVGNDVAATWRALLDGRSGGAPITRFDAEKFAVRFACEVKDFDAGEYMDRKEAKRADLYTQYAMAASVQAMRDAGFGDGAGPGTGYVPEETGVIIGSGIGGLRTMEEQHANYLAHGPRRISPFFVPMFISDIAAGVVSMRFGCKGPNFATVSACSTSAHAVGVATRAIQHGEADVMLAGGSEAAVTPMAIGGFASMGALSTRNDSPETASRPFDATRDGFVLGEGAGVVVLEALEHALARGAHIYGEVAGYASRCNAFHMTGLQPEGKEMAAAIDAAMDRGRLIPADIDYINAHGSGTKQNDLHETGAFKLSLGERAYRVPVSGFKSMIGHSLGAIGSLEIAGCLLAFEEGLIPPTANLEDPDPACDLDYVPKEAREQRIDTVLTVGSGFGGFQSAMVLRKIGGAR